MATKEGAFTGAKRGGHAGVFEMADGGTLFLDEIGEMPLQLQSRLLRVLEERQVVRVGGIRPININVRIISATHCDLQKRMQEGLFRRDLYFRLAVLPLYLPSLRERIEDIPQLSDMVLKNSLRRTRHTPSAYLSARNFKLCKFIIELYVPRKRSRVAQYDGTRGTVLPCKSTSRNYNCPVKKTHP